METLEKKITHLPIELRNEVNDFIDFLISKRTSKVRKTPNLRWIGGLKKFNKKYTALELQKKEPSQIE